MSAATERIYVGGWVEAPVMRDDPAAIEAAVREVCRQMSTTPYRLRCMRHRCAAISTARCVGVGVLRKLGLSFPETARALGMADHASAIYHAKRLAKDEVLRSWVDSVLEALP